MATIDMTIKHESQDIKIEIGNVYCKVISKLPDKVIKRIDESLSYFVEGYKFSKAFKNGFWDPKEKKFKHWDGKKHLFYNKNAFNTGLLDRVKDILSEFNIDPKLIDRRTIIEYGKELPINNFELRQYQEDAIKLALEKKSGIIKIGTGGGKSIVIASLVAKFNIKTVIIVPSIDLLYQTKETIEKVIGQEIGIIGDGIADIKKITISTVWSAANALSKKALKFDEEEFGRKEKFQTKDKQKIAKAIQEMELMIVDECHISSCQSLQIINTSSKNCRFKFGFSGTPQKFTGEDLLIEGVFGRKIIDVPATELISNGFLVKPTIHFISIPESSEYIGETYQSIYKNYIVENENRNNKIIELIKKLKLAGRKSLILVKNIKHGQNLMEMFDKDTIVYFVRGELNSDERNKIRNDFVKGKIDVIVASAVYDQGIDIANLDALILAGSGKSAGRALQRIGRVIRLHPGKKNAIVIDFIDNAKYLFEHSIKRLDIYKMESGFEIKLPKNWKRDGEKEKTQKIKPMFARKPGDKMPW